MDYMHIFPLHNTIPTYLLVIRDNLSTFCELTPSHRGTTTDAARALCMWFSRYGYNTSVLMSDRGSHFITDVIRKIAETTRTKQHFHQPYCKWSNGTVERTVRSAREAFRLVMHDMGLTAEQWTDAIPLVQMILNTNKRRDLGYKSPIEIFTGIPQKNPLKGLVTTGADLKTVKVHTPDVNKIRAHLMKLSDDMRVMHTKVVDKRIKRQLQNRKQQKDAVPGRFQVGDYVLVAHRSGKKKLKLFANWRGPMQVRKQISEWLFEVQPLGSEENANVEVVHSRLMKFFAASDCEQTRELTLSAQGDVDVFEVEKIVDHKYDFEKQALLLKIKWRGFADAFSTWEPVEHMLNYCRHLIVEYLRDSAEEDDSEHIQTILSQIVDHSMAPSQPQIPAASPGTDDDFESD